MFAVGQTCKPDTQGTSSSQGLHTIEHVKIERHDDDSSWHGHYQQQPSPEYLTNQNKRTQLTSSVIKIPDDAGVILIVIAQIGFIAFPSKIYTC